MPDVVWDKLFHPLSLTLLNHILWDNCQCFGQSGDIFDQNVITCYHDFCLFPGSIRLLCLLSRIILTLWMLMMLGWGLAWTTLVRLMHFWCTRAFGRMITCTAACGQYSALVSEVACRSWSVCQALQLLRRLRARAALLRGAFMLVCKELTSLFPGRLATGSISCRMQCFRVSRRTALPMATISRLMLLRIRLHY